MVLGHRLPPPPPGHGPPDTYPKDIYLPDTYPKDTYSLGHIPPGTDTPRCISSEQIRLVQTFDTERKKN